MTKLEAKVANALNETRMLILGAQALLGFQFTAFLANGFEEMPQQAKLVHCGEFYIAAGKVGSADGPAIAATLLALSVFPGLWFAFPLLARAGRSKPGRRALQAKHQ